MFYIPQGDLRPRKRRVFKDGQMRDQWLMNGREVADPDAGQDFSDRPTAEADDVTKVPRLIALMRQAEPDMDVWKDEVRSKNLQDWMAHALSATQAESEVSRLRQTSENRGQATHGPRFVRSGNPDHELLDNAEAWNKARKL